MRYESLLASRYIKAQKRQSVFTVVSIAVAVAVMTMLFVLYGVLLGNVREASFKEKPYHLMIYDWPENKASALRNEEYVQSVSFERIEAETQIAYALSDAGIDFEDAENRLLIAKITFQKGIENPKTWLTQVADKYGVKTDYFNSWTDPDGWGGGSVSGNLYAFNQDLLVMDWIGRDAIEERFLTFCFFLAFVLLFSLGLRLMVDTAFEVSSKERERHYGVLQSIGATPGQITGIITREGLRLCAVAIPIGLALGVLFAFGMYHAVLSAGASDLMRSESSGGYQPSFFVQPRMLLISAAVGLVWTFFSVYGVGMRVVKKSPMEAITGRGKREKPARRPGGKLSGEITLLGPLSGLLFGLPGRIAYRNTRRQKKRFRITVLTLTVSITLFAVFSALASSVEGTLLRRIRERADSGADFVVKPTDDMALMETVELLKNSGLFHEVRFYENKWLEFPTEDPAPDALCYPMQVTIFADPLEYQRIFGDKPPVPYETLAESRGVVYVRMNEHFEIFQRLSDAYTELLSEGGPATLSLNSYATFENADGTTERVERQSHAFTLWAMVDVPQNRSEEYGIYNDYSGCLIGTIDTWLEMRDEMLDDKGDYDEEIAPYLNDGEIYLYIGEEIGYSQAAYQKIQSLFSAYSDQIYVSSNTYHEGLETQDRMAVIRVIVLILNTFIALAALINLVNIISTGIANRRGELTSLQCVGMTEGELLRMTLIECLQYVLKAALASAVICGLIIVGFQQWFLPWVRGNGADELAAYYMPKDQNAGWVFDMVRLNVAEIFGKLLLASAAAFAAGCAASVAMLRAQRRQSLSDRIRSVE